MGLLAEWSNWRGKTFVASRGRCHGAIRTHGCGRTSANAILPTGLSGHLDGVKTRVKTAGNRPERIGAGVMKPQLKSHIAW